MRILRGFNVGWHGQVLWQLGNGSALKYLMQLKKLKPLVINELCRKWAKGGKPTKRGGGGPSVVFLSCPGHQVGGLLGAIQSGGANTKGWCFL